MSHQLKIFISLVFGLLWAGSLLTIALFSQDFKITLALIMLIGLSFGMAGYLWYFRQHYGQRLEHSQLLKIVHETLANHHEIHLFDESGKNLFSTHPHLYPNKKEFLRRLMLKVKSGAEASNFRKWVEEHYPGQILLESGGKSPGQLSRWWLVNSEPIDPLLTGGTFLLLITMTEVTQYFENYYQLKSSYQQLESFVDHIPFGLFYLNSTHHIVGSNATFNGWLNLSREKVLGQPLSFFVEGVEDKTLSFIHPQFPHHPGHQLVKIKPEKGEPFKALLFSSPSSIKNRVFVLCRFDNQTYLTNPEGQDFDKQDLFNQAPIPSIIVQGEGQIVAFNPAFATMLSDIVTIKDGKLKLGGNLYEILHPSNRAEVETRLRNVATFQTLSVPFEMVFEGVNRHTTAYVTTLNSNLGVPSPLLIQFIDISEQKRLEQQFIQSQKMQAVGQLAGGIAHDFNNLLTAMIGFCDLLLQRYMPSDPSYTDIIQIKQNANRAANLVRQLLAFSRQQNLQPKVINITDTLAELSALLRRLIGAGIDLQMIHGRDLWPVRVDVSQLEQVIINLVVNARDAMPQGGNLTIRTGHYHLSRPRQLGHDLIPAGDYILIEVVDTGHGILKQHLEHIFEPFFSTKELGAGTGLGLSTVYGIVKQTGGFISVESEVDNGTIFKILLPRYQGNEPISSLTHEPIVADLTGSETILLVEDEDAVRLFSARALREKGYRVLEANSGDAALDIIKKGEMIDLLVTDVVMPKMDGPTLHKKVRDLLPHLKTIFISGYSEDTFRRNLGDNAQIHFLAKPFTLKDLAAKVKEVLHAKRMSLRDKP